MIGSVKSDSSNPAFGLAFPSFFPFFDDDLFFPFLGGIVEGLLMSRWGAGGGVVNVEQLISFKNIQYRRRVLEFSPRIF